MLMPRWFVFMVGMMTGKVVMTRLGFVAVCSACSSIGNIDCHGDPEGIEMFECSVYIPKAAKYIYMHMYLNPNTPRFVLQALLAVQL